MKKLRGLLICLIFSFLVCAGSRPFFQPINRPATSVCAENPCKDLGEAD